MPIESSGHSAANPRLYELIENAPKEGPSPTVWAWPQFIAARRSCAWQVVMVRLSLALHVLVD